MGQGPLPLGVAFGGACAAAALLGTGSAGHCGRAPVGSCTASDCLPTFGPTTCVSGQCICKDGFCFSDAGSGEKLCRAQVGTCNILSCDSSHGGSNAVECIDGLCLCHSGFHADEDGVCQRGWWPPPLLMEVANASGRGYNPSKGVSKAEVGQSRGSQELEGQQAIVGRLPAVFAAIVPAAVASLLAYTFGQRDAAVQPHRVVGEDEGAQYQPLPATGAARRAHAAAPGLPGSNRGPGGPGGLLP
mmetsp:Transcript_150832/g.420404  ORF Transcript_150832/g.420404 Transcript_150832/m.420404 type:complete len:245 (+) Transcript_150832:62-796(+)